MKNAIIQEIENKQLKTDIPDFRAGDTVKVSLRIIEGKKNVCRFLKAWFCPVRVKG